MAMQYINYIKAKAHLATSKPSETPVLSEEDEQFLDQLTSQENPPPLPPRPELVATLRDAQVALMDGAQNIPLPQTPSEVTDEPTMIENGPEAGTTESAATNPKATWSWYRRDSREIRQQGRETTAAGLDDIVANLKKTEEGDSDEVKEAKREEEDMTIVLERLNLAAINNRVFSISDETQELLRQFNLVFKDLVNGVPTAYDDLEKLLTNGDRQLQKTFNSLPGFLQKLIERLPETMTKGLAPEIMAAAAERASRSGMNMGNAGKAAAAASKFGFKTPSLKELVGKPAAISGMLRSIVGYLRARFPAFMGANVLWSLAMFVLLFVFWYCHKRGKEVRLEKERKLTEDELQSLDAEFKAEYGDDMPTTTAEAGASIEDVKAGVKEAAALREAGMEEDAVTEKSVDPAIIPPTTVP
ncbi:hypothetical protein LTR72_002700 [Exophiala xenobiotica]|nr:hypothetical protein LTR72_002700 [Exophiala xenobiotica]KAK5300459.1 hypothetical protein LTR14_000855 [Exophiala xenobiotica]KAK5315532.1 hypothetical protein LTR93_009787 [Exophiala xenobiotica]KAK5402810.1 hypothetical protein LTR06_010527 [Exophiala xenobiotica]KAK5471775.1 hypothetical protein LTR55_010642 [Exophiala xenobiotica]